MLVVKQAFSKLESGSSDAIAFSQQVTAEAKKAYESTMAIAGVPERSNAQVTATQRSESGIAASSSQE